MYPRPPAPPVVRKPTLPLSFEPIHDVPDLPPLESVIQTLMTMAVTADKDQLVPYLERMSYVLLRGGPHDLLLVAIDPTTGDSVLHRAAAAGNINALDAVLSSWGHSFGSNNLSVRLLWVLVVHQNLAGDTALHAAARVGSVRAAKALYRLFFALDFLDVDDSLHDDEASRPEPASTDYIPEPPWEYFDWSTEVDDIHGHLPVLDFVCTKNRAGRDVAEEARSAGHEDMAVWLDGLVARIDRDGMKEDKDYMRDARREALEVHWYLDDNEEN